MTSHIIHTQRDLKYHTRIQLTHPTLLSVTPLILAKAVIVSFFNPFRRAQAERDAGAITVQVKWGRERFNIPIPSPSLTPLSTLLATLANQTYLPLDSLKVIYKGAVLKDPSLTIASYGITDGATLVLVGKGGEVPGAGGSAVGAGAGAGVSAGAAPGAGVAARKKPKQPETTTESVLVSWISSLVSSLLDPLRPSIVTFISYTSPNATNRPAQIPPFAQLQKEHARLSELLLKALLELDGVDIPSGWSEARKERKEGVRKVQGELNRVDEAWGERKKIGA